MSVCENCGEYTRRQKRESVCEHYRIRILNMSGGVKSAKCRIR